jgi:pectate lyase
LNSGAKRNNITFAGQTAPGDGICIKGESFNLGGSYNVIVRHMRFRTGAYTPDSVEVNAASFILENGGNFIVDHCTMSWSSEELCDIADDTNWTTQWCIFAEGLYASVNGKGARSYGPVIAGDGASFHHNLIAHIVSRAPRFGVTTSVIPHVLIDYVNNVNYNFGKKASCYGRRE